MPAKRIVGIILIAIGIVSLVWGGVFWTERETILDAGPLEVQHVEEAAGVELVEHVDQRHAHRGHVRHAQSGDGPDLVGPSRIPGHRHDGGLRHDDAAALDVHQGVRRAEVDREIGREDREERAKSQRIPFQS